MSVSEAYAPSSVSVALRIVVFGPPSAGKTSTARALARSLGQEVVTPQEGPDGSTAYFDWLEYLGGRHDGHPILTQVVAVPGSDERRRKALLETADAVLFVAHSTETGLAATIQSFDEMMTVLAGRDGPVPFVVQANFRDRPDAIPMAELSDRMRLPEGTIAVETVAADGEGVRQAYVYAVRCGLERVKATASEHPPAQATPDELLEWLQSLPEQDGSRAQAPAAEPGDAIAPPPATTADDTPATAPAAEHDDTPATAPAAEHDDTPATAPAAEHDDPGFRPPLPPRSEQRSPAIAAGPEGRPVAPTVGDAPARLSEPQISVPIMSTPALAESDPPPAPPPAVSPPSGQATAGGAPATERRPATVRRRSPSPPGDMPPPPVGRPGPPPQTEGEAEASVLKRLWRHLSS